MNPLQFRPDAGADLLRIEDCLLRSVRADDTLLTEIASHLIPAGGKRLRPSFVAASALLGAPDPLVPAALTDDIVRGSVSVELVHLGSLYHDDVMDDAETRHGVDSVNFRWGNLRAILAGDFLLARASEIAASLGTDVAALLAATIGWLCEGQVRELQRMFDVSRSEESYLDAINGKTAALYSTACRIGALVSDLPDDTTDRLSDFGQAYGMAFQIVDDIHDLRSTDARMGKPVGNDLRAASTRSRSMRRWQRADWRRAARPARPPPRARRLRRTALAIVRWARWRERSPSGPATWMRPRRPTRPCRPVRPRTRCVRRRARCWPSPPAEGGLSPRGRSARRRSGRGGPALDGRGCARLPALRR